MGSATSHSYRRVEVDMLQMYELVARRLAGRNVEVTMQPMARYDGLTMKGGTGKALVFIKPGLGLETEFHVFLHEVGHVKHDIPNFASSTPAAIRASFDEVPKLPTKPLHKLSRTMMEGKAERQADTWERWASKNAILGTTVFSKLVALLSYPQCLRMSSKSDD